MNVLSSKKFGSFLAFKSHFSDPYGKIADICILQDKGKISGYILETLSLIPTRLFLTAEDFEIIDGQRLLLKKNFLKKSISDLTGVLYFKKDIIGIKVNGKYFKKINDFNFNIETGEIFDFTAKRTVFDKKEKFLVNKLQIIDNTIYINQREVVL